MQFTILVIGASGIIAQIVLIRELLVVFQCNELSIGLIVGNWLIAEALGSFLYRRIKVSVSIYKSIILTFTLTFPFLIVLTRLIRPLLGILPGEIVTIPAMYLSSFLLLLPVGFLHGALFTSSASILSQNQPADNLKIPGYIYILENLGTIIGGIILSFLLIPYLSSLKISFLLGVINLLAVLILSKLKPIYIQYLSSALILLFCYGIIISPHIEQWTLRRNFPDYNILNSVNTIYSNITVINREEQFIFLVDGNPAITVPYFDQNFIEDFVNFPLLQHPNPKQVLLIGGGAGGTIDQMLEYNLDKIVYLELDPNLIQTIRKFLTPLTEKELSDPRVEIINSDARHYLEKDTRQYDLIFISFLSPLSLQTNRFFSQEFFTACYNKLNNNGILVTISPGSTTYLRPTLNNVIASHLKTLQQVFPIISILGGDFNLYLSYKDTINTQLNANTLYNRLLVRNINTKLFSLGYIQHRTQGIFYNQLSNTLQMNSPDLSLINQDGLPRGLFYNLFYKNTITNPSLKPLFFLIQKISFPIIFMFIIIIFLMLYLLNKQRLRSINISFAIFSTGVVAMIFTFVLSLGFQIRYGYLYYQISILLTTFIAGSVLGGFFGNLISTVKKRLFFISEMLIIILLTLIILSLQNSAYPRLFNFQIDFFIFLFMGGFSVGFQFPIANRILHKNDQTVTSVVGKLYASDLFGGFVGAILIPIISIPMIGITQTLFLAILLKTTSTILVLTSK